MASLLPDVIVSFSTHGPYSGKLKFSHGIKISHFLPVHSSIWKYKLWNFEHANLS